MIKLVLLVCFCCVCQQNVFSQSNLVRSTTGASGASVDVVQGDHAYVVQQSIGQPSAIGTYTNTEGYNVRQGFIQPNILSKIIDKNTPITLQLHVYPNPFDVQITLGFQDDITSEIAITVFNMLGARVFSSNYKPSQKLDLNLNMLPSGEYILKAVANKKQFIEKIIKR
ncbi:T9SS type A sorting domain-containing protein [Mariniflexile sp. AS56]|uniref:T9SS type A sorting domain-containing protein n=1 Tax=Mariniflexile sp. AS56 TaxID=3063957 RepID=UPI0026F33CE2|nr:T9SS type A sorting domain-containing protein [Mariniflexile sp. AS56]MDO7174139.1 T9SS type A sorting domain-containing protein [Mariniflexile sp. AS56]